MAVTLHDVAEAAGVSISSASRLLRGDPTFRVSPATRRTIRRAAKRLGYRHNGLAKALRSGRSHLIGILNSSMYYPFLGELVERLELETRSRGYETTIYNCSSANEAEKVESEAEAVKRFLEARVDGIIVTCFASDRNSPSILRQILKAGIPLVFVRERAIIEADSVPVDYERGGAIAAEHLLHLGHRRVAVIAYHTEVGAQGRLAGFLKIINESSKTSGRMSCRVITYMDPATRAGHFGYRHVSHLLQTKCPPTGIFCHNDFVAMGALKAIYDAGMRVPQDISVIGFDAIAMSEFTIPPLTTLSQSVEVMVKQGMDLLMSRMEQGQNGRPCRTLPVEPELVVRESTGPVGKSTGTPPGPRGRIEEVMCGKQ